MANDILTIDGITYPVNIVSLTETSEFVDKYATRTEDWDLQRELVGIFFNYELEFGDIQDQVLFNSLYNKLHEFASYHDMTLPHNDSLITFKAYVTSVSRDLVKRKNGVNKWSGFKVKFIAKAPYITS